MHKTRRIKSLTGIFVVFLWLGPALPSLAQRATPAQRVTPAPSSDLQIKLGKLEQQRAVAVGRKASRKPGEQELKTESEGLRRRLLENYRRGLEARNAAVRAKFGPGATLGVMPEPTPDSCTTPKITLISADETLEAGEELIVNGCGFGTKHSQSELRLLGNFEAGSYLPLKIIEWKGYTILAKAPIVTGEIQPAKLQVKTKDLKLSNQVNIEFQPWDVLVVSREVVQVKSCWGSGPLHNCQRAYPSFSATHGSWSDQIIDDGSDSITATVKSPWTFVGLAWWWWYLTPQFPAGYVILAADPFSPGSSSVPPIFVNWSAYYGGGVEYLVHLYVLGPKGKPYK